jgi:hypothetical protein
MRPLPLPPLQMLPLLQPPLLPTMHLSQLQLRAAARSAATWLQRR